MSIPDHRACLWPQPSLSTGDPRHDFRLEEYRSLRQEIAASVEESRKIETYCALAAAAVWVWVLDQPASLSAALGSLIPVLVAILGGVRAFALYHVINAMAAYLLEVEEVYRQQTLAGWEHFNSFAANDVNQRPRALERKYLSRSAWLFWLLLLGAAMLFSLVAWVAVIVAILCR